MLEVREIHTCYGRNHVLQGVSLDVEGGEIVTLIGRNGAGKSTTHEEHHGHHAPRQGQILFQGEALTGLATHLIARRGIAFVPEERRIFPNLTVAENLRLGLLKNKGRASAPGGEAAVVERVLGYFPRLRERRRQAGGSLSGGEQQMLAIARALVAEPTLLLIDEPTAGLMPTMVQAIQDILVRLYAAGVTLLLVEQNVKMAWPSRSAPASSTRDAFSSPGRPGRSWRTATFSAGTGRLSQGRQGAPDAAPEAQHAPHEDGAHRERPAIGQPAQIVLQHQHHARPDQRPEEGAHAAQQGHDHHRAGGGPEQVLQRHEAQKDGVQPAGEAGAGAGDQGRQMLDHGGVVAAGPGALLRQNQPKTSAAASTPQARPCHRPSCQWMGVSPVV
jgi:branched-chain amino acid transport system ATP-binding protein